MADIRVLLVDDQDIIRQGMATILRYSPGVAVVGQARNGREAIEQTLTLEPDVVLMDLKMPVLGGIPAIREIMQQRPETHVVILTTFDTDDLVFEGIKAGAQGYLLKDAEGERIVEAIHGVVEGQTQLDPTVARKVLGEFQRLADLKPEPQKRADEEDLIIEPLTPREQDVLELLVEGLSNREIGAQLFLSEGTIKNHVSNIIGKLQANDRTHAVVRALRHGLAEL